MKTTNVLILLAIFIGLLAVGLEFRNIAVVFLGEDPGRSWREGVVYGAATFAGAIILYFIGVALYSA